MDFESVFQHFDAFKNDFCGAYVLLFSKSFKFIYFKNKQSNLEKPDNLACRQNEGWLNICSLRNKSCSLRNYLSMPKSHWHYCIERDLVTANTGSFLADIIPPGSQMLKRTPPNWSRGWGVAFLLKSNRILIKKPLQISCPKSFEAPNGRTWLG